jgi:hypothetical protein
MKTKFMGVVARALNALRPFPSLRTIGPYLAVIALAVILPHDPHSIPVLGLAFAGAIMDSTLEFADAVSVAAAAGTALIGNVVDLTVVRDIGNGQPVYLVITTDTEIITGGNAGTINFQLVSDAQAAIAIDGTATVHLDTGPFVTDDAAVNDARLNAGGVIFCGPIPLEGKPYEQYLGILAVIATTTVTAGKINAYLTLDPPVRKSYPNAANA